MIARSADPADLAVGVALVGLRSGVAAGRVALLPARLVLRAPFVGPPLQRRAG